MARLGSLHSARPALCMADSPSGRNISGKEGGRLRGATLPAFRRLGLSCQPNTSPPACQVSKWREHSSPRTHPELVPMAASWPAVLPFLW